MSNTHICDSPNCTHPSHNKKYLPLVNFHQHSSFSMLDGVGRPEEYIKLAKEYNIPGITITDHGNAIGIYDFYKKVKAAGLKPILGEEFYLCTDLSIRLPNRERDVHTKDKHQTVLIKNKEGYKNFCKLNYLSYTEGYYYKPRVSYEMLLGHNKGLVVTSGCAASMFNQLMIKGKENEAEEWFKRFVDTFGEDFIGEIQFNELNDVNKYGMDQFRMNDFIIRMCNKYDTKIIIGGDTHYATPEDAKLQDILIACQRRKDGPADTANLESFIHARHLFFHNSDHYFEFNKKFDYNYDNKFIEQCLQNSLDISNEINFDFDTETTNYPKFPVPNNITSENYLEDLAYKGLLKKMKERKENDEKFSDELIEKYEQQLEYELKVITDKKYTDYFLVFQDWTNWAKNQGFWLGPARGSAGGSLLAYALDITDLDPIKFNLYFERFLNPERSAKPDIDCDIEQGEREHVREYLENKYGKDSVFGVATYHLYHAKSAIQDISRGLGKDTSQTSTLMREVTKLPDFESQKDLTEYFQNIKLISTTTSTVLQWIEENQDTIYWAQKVLGACKNIGTHAGGIIVTPGPVYDYIPVARGGGEIVTAFRESEGSAKDLSELGILKLDILGVKTLNVLKNSINDIKRDLNIDITNKVKFVDLEDPKLYEKFRKGNNIGVFQFADSKIDGLIKSIDPDCFEDVVAINAINRPGPLEHFAPVYGKWKRWEKEKNTKELKAIENVRYPFEFMKEPLKQSYGCMLYQEQLMLMAVSAAGFTMGEADLLRRAITYRKDHPKYYTVKAIFDKLSDGMYKKGYSEADVETFLEYCRRFSGYSYNKAHALAYAYLAMQTIYLKVYYPEYFYANLLNVEIPDNYQSVITDAVANGVNVLPVSINKSKIKFTIENKSIRVGFIALKGLGEKAAEELEMLNLSQYNNVSDVLTLPYKKANSKAFQCLIDVGAFDEFNIPREKVESIRNLYKDSKLEKWFTRKRNPLEIKTLPECLKQFPENIIFSILEKIKEKEEPWKHLILELIPYIKVKETKKEQAILKEEEVLGFSFETVKHLTKLLNIEVQYPSLNLKTLSSRETEEDLCYWIVLKKTISKTKRGKEYLTLDITDNNTKIKAKCWEMIDIKKNKTYVSNIKRDNWGYTIVCNDFLTEIDLDDDSI